MDAAAAGVAATPGGGGSSLPKPPPRKQWRAVSEQSHPHHHNHQPGRNPGDNPELEQPKLGHSDERTIYEVQHGREPIDVDFCLINVDGSQDNEILQQRVQSIAREREHLLLLEVELRARMIARPEILEMHNRFDAQLKEHADATVKLQEQLHAKERTIHDLERRMEEKDRELHAIKLDNEAVWAKDDLLREQNKELATFRKERDHSEAERAQHIQQICDLQEHIQDKERQILELQERHRAAQETIYLKDEQLKVLISRAQEMDALQSTASHSLHTELQERTEQYNQLWHGCQRQFAEMERLHLHAMQQLQLELADARERSRSYNDESCVTQTNSNDLSKLIFTNGNQHEVNGSNGTSSNNGAVSPMNADNASSFSTTGNASSQNNHAAGVPFPPSSLLGMPAYLPPGQVAALHPYILHHQGISHSVPSHASQSHVGHFPSIQSMPSFPQWHNLQNQLDQPQTDQNLSRSEGKYEFEMAINGHGFSPTYTNVHIGHELEPDLMPKSSAVEQQVQPNEAVDSIDQSFLVASSMDHGIQQISSQVASSLNLSSLEHNGTKEHHVLNATDEVPEGQSLAEEELSTVASASLSETSVHSVNLTEVAINNGSGAIVSDAYVSSGQPNLVTAAKTQEPSLLDERALLACIVRTVPAGGRIRINSTLPNRLGKMLAPLHWHDYKKIYGKLDDFVAGHPEFFFIEGDYIQLREGAQETIAAKAAVAKVAAATAALSSYSSFLPSVAVTPMAQSHRLKKVPSVDSKLQNGQSFGAKGSVSNVRILSKSKDSRR